MNVAGFLLLFAGWVIVAAAVALLHSAMLTGFVLAGMGVEVLGFVLVFSSHRMARED
jgi:hypothetical protein